MLTGVNEFSIKSQTDYNFLLSILGPNNTGIDSVHFFYEDLNSMSENVLKAFALKLRADKFLKKLDLWFRKIDDRKLSIITDAFTENTTLTELLLGSNSISEAGIAYLASNLNPNNNLNKISLKQNKISINVSNLIVLIEKCKKLKSIDLSSTGMTSSEAQLFAKAIEQHQTLQEIDVSSNQLGDAGAIALLKVMLTSKAQRLIDLTKTGLTSATINFLGDNLTAENNINSLEVTQNSLTGSGDGLRKILMHNKIRSLSLETTDLSPEDINALSEGLKVNTSLESLYLYENTLPNEQLINLIEALIARVPLKKLSLQCCELPEIADTFSENIIELIESGDKEKLKELAAALKEDLPLDNFPWPSKKKEHSRESEEETVSLSIKPEIGDGFKITNIPKQELVDFLKRAYPDKATISNESESTYFRFRDQNKPDNFLYNVYFKKLNLNELHKFILLNPDLKFELPVYPRVKTKELDELGEQFINLINRNENIQYLLQHDKNTADKYIAMHIKSYHRKKMVPFEELVQSSLFQLLSIQAQEKLKAKLHQNKLVAIARKYLPPQILTGTAVFALGLLFIGVFLHLSLFSLTILTTTSILSGLSHFLLTKEFELLSIHSHAHKNITDDKVFHQNWTESQKASYDLGRRSTKEWMPYLSALSKNATITNEFQLGWYEKSNTIPNRLKK